MGQHETRALAEIAKTRETGLLLTAFLAALTLGSVWTGANALTSVLTIAILALSVGSYFEGQRKLALAWRRDFAEEETVEVVDQKASKPSSRLEAAKLRLAAYERLKMSKTLSPKDLAIARDLHARQSALVRNLENLKSP